MLLKTIRTPSQAVLRLDLEVIGDHLTPKGVEAIRNEFLEDKGIRPVISEEHVIELYQEYKIYRINVETKQIGNFAGDMNLPHNCVAVIIQDAPSDMCIPNIIYITSDMEAYIISDTGVTVSVVNGKKTVDEKNLRPGIYRHPSDASHITIHGGNVKIDTPHLNIHGGVDNKNTGPAK